MDFPTLCTLLPEAADANTLETAIACARHFESHLDVVCVAAPPVMTGAYMSGFGGGMIAETLVETRAELEVTEERARTRLSREEISWSTHAVMGTADALNHIVKEACRFADIAVLPRPNRDRLESEAMFDAVLFGTALPILLGNGPDAPAHDRMIIAWDGSDQALAATRAALPLLRQARVVSIVMVDPPHSPAGRFAPGEGLATFLSRHGIDCDIDLLPRMKEKTSDVLKQHLRDTQADLMVMGAYGHSRLRESLLGGVTRDLIQSSDVPLFLAR